MRKFPGCVDVRLIFFGQQQIRQAKTQISNSSKCYIYNLFTKKHGRQAKRLKYLKR